MFQLALKIFRVICCAVGEMANLHLGQLRRAGAESFIPAMRTQLDFHLVYRDCFLHTKQEAALIVKRSNAFVCLDLQLLGIPS